MMTAEQLLSLSEDFKSKTLALRQSDKYPFYNWCCQNVIGYKTVAGNLAFRLKVIEECAASEEARRDYYAMCSRDALFYVNTFCFTYDPRLLPNIPFIPFVTYDFQDVAIDDTLDSIWTGRDLVLEKSRDQGASWILASVNEWCWHFKPGFTSLLGSRNETYVDNPSDPKSLFWKIDFIHKNLPGWFLPELKRIYLHFENYDNGATIGGESTTGDFARGGRWTVINLDEFAAVEPDGEKVLKATRDATRCRIFNSTHQGTHTRFYAMSVGKTRKLQLHWSLHPLKQVGLYYSKDGKLVLCDKNFKGKVTLHDGTEVQFPDQYPFRLDGKLRSPYYDYECDRASHPMEIAQELDMDPCASASMFFVGEVIEKIKAENCRPPLHIGYLEFDPDTLEPTGFVEQDGGPMRLWFHPDADGSVPKSIMAAIGFDISTGTGASNSTASVGNLVTREKIAEFVSPWIMPESYGALAVAMAKWFNDAYMIWDGGGAGGIFGKVIVDAGYRNFYYSRQEDRLFNKESDKPGFWFNPNSKKTIFAAFRGALKDGGFIQRSVDAAVECMSYVFTIRMTVEHSSEYDNIDPSGAKSSHGDRVIADALLNKAFEKQNVEAEDVKDDYVPWNCPKAREEKALEKIANEGNEPFWEE
jgi:hypothetical protein